MCKIMTTNQFQVLYGQAIKWYKKSNLDYGGDLYQYFLEISRS
jgi:hypothetical protein